MDIPYLDKTNNQTLLLSLVSSCHMSVLTHIHLHLHKLCAIVSLQCGIVTERHIESVWGVCQVGWLRFEF